MRTTREIANYGRSSTLDTATQQRLNLLRIEEVLTTRPFDPATPPSASLPVVNLEHALASPSVGESSEEELRHEVVILAALLSHRLVLQPIGLPWVAPLGEDKPDPRRGG
jgi:hypothetical protein